MVVIVVARNLEMYDPIWWAYFSDVVRKFNHFLPCEQKNGQDIWDQILPCWVVAWLQVWGTQKRRHEKNKWWELLWKIPALLGTNISPTSRHFWVDDDSIHISFLVGYVMVPWNAKVFQSLLFKTGDSKKKNQIPSVGSCHCFAAFVFVIFPGWNSSLFIELKGQMIWDAPVLPVAVAQKGMTWYPFLGVCDPKQNLYICIYFCHWLLGGVSRISRSLICLVCLLHLFDQGTPNPMFFLSKTSGHNYRTSPQKVANEGKIPFFFWEI